jgi:hypothetical protein
VVIVALIDNDSSYVVEFYKGDTLIGTDDTSPYTNLALQNPPMGPYSINVKSVNGQGTLFSSPDTHFIVRCIREDINNDGVVNTFDFLLLLAAYGLDCNNGCPEDFNDDMVVSTLDFLRILTKLGYSCL